MKVLLQSLHSPDLPDLKKNIPPDPKHFCILVQAMIGPEEGEGEESFDILLCTPSWLAENLDTNAYTWGRFYLFVPKYDFAIVWKAVENICSGIDVPDWDSAAAVLSQYGKWEFENYTH